MDCGIKFSGKLKENNEQIILTLFIIAVRLIKKREFSILLINWGILNQKLNWLLNQLTVFLWASLPSGELVSNLKCSLEEEERLSLSQLLSVKVKPFV